MPGPIWILLRGLHRVKALCRSEAGTHQKTQDGMLNKNTDSAHSAWLTPASSYPFCALASLSIKNGFSNTYLLG